MRLDLHHHSAIAPVAEEWDDLAERLQSSPFLRPGWFDAWWRAFGSGRLEIVTLRRDARVVAVLPLRRLRGVLHSLTNWHSPEFGLVAEDAASRRELVERLLAHGNSPVSLGFLTAGDPDHEAVLDAALATGCRVLSRPLEESPYVMIESSWEEYERTLSKTRRSDLRRRRRRLSDLGSLSVEFADGRERLDALLEEGFSIEASGWKRESGTAIASSPQTREFYVTVAGWAAERGWLRLAFLRLEGRPLAFQFLIEAHGVASFLKGGYDRDYRRYGPGILLAHAVIGHAFETGLTSYEFLGTDDPYKLEFAHRVRQRQLLQCFPRTPAGTASWLSYRYGRPLAKRTKDLVAR